MFKIETSISDNCCLLLSCSVILGRQWRPATGPDIPTQIPGKNLISIHSDADPHWFYADPDTFLILNTGTV